MYNIYLVSTLSDSGKIYKIGYTKRSVEKRVKEFTTGNSNDFTIEQVFTCDKYGTKIEALLHKRFSTCKIKGEWFNLTDDDASNFILTCEKIESNFKALESNDIFKKMMGI